MLTYADVWYLFPDAIRDPELLNDYWNILSNDEISRCERFCFDRDRHRHLVTWALARTMLSNYADISPKAWEFGNNQHGRPHISGPVSAPNLRFNLSHTRSLIACIVAPELDVGIDVEDCRRNISGPAIARRYFSAREVAAFERLTKNEHAAAFFEYWTLKEAYVKAVGRGISLGLARFSFELDDRSLRVDDPERRPPRISFDGLNDDPATWQFAQYKPTPHHAMAIAIRCGVGKDLKIRLKEVGPNLASC